MVHIVSEIILSLFGTFLSFASFITAITISAVLLFGDLFRKLLEMREIEAEELKENFREAGLEEPHFLRDLGEEEKELLTKKTRKLRAFINNPKKIILLAFLMFLIALATLSGILFFLDLEPVGIDLSFKNVLYGVTPLALLFSYWIVRYQFKEEKYFYYDLRLPVMRLQGKLIPLQGFDTSNEHFFRVRGRTFRVPKIPGVPGKFNIRIKRALDELKDKEVVVEYSPYARVVWDVREAPHE